jgi:uncharacterized protein
MVPPPVAPPPIAPPPIAPPPLTATHRVPPPRRSPFGPPKPIQPWARHWPRTWIVVGACAFVGAQLLSLAVLLAYVFSSGSDALDGDFDIPLWVLAVVQFTTYVVQLAAVTWVIKRRSSTGRWADLGLGRPTWAHLGIGVGTWFGSYFIIIPLSLVMKQEQGLDEITNEFGSGTGRTVSIVIFALLIAVGAPLVEELLFRGLLQTAITARWNHWWAIIVPSVLFGLIHLQPRNMLVLTALGLIYAVVRHFTHSVWPSLIAHGLNNGVAAIALLALS